MPTVLRVNGFQIVVYTHDHLPKHVHVKYGGDVVILEIATGAIIRASRMAANDIRAAQSIVVANAAFLESEWDRIKPIP